MTDKKIKIAVIGAGSIATSQHIPNYKKLENVEIKYVVDIIPERAEQAAEKFGIPFMATDYKTILNDPELEAVSVCTPNYAHAPITIDFLNAGKHVLCEKPAALNLTEAKQMQEAAVRNNKMLNIGVVNRYNTAVNHIKNMINAGELGDIYHVYCSFRAHRSIPGLGGAFTTKEKSGGGVLVDWGVHFLDIIFYCLGDTKINSVSGAVYNEMAKDMQSYAYTSMWAGPPDYSGINDVEDFVTGLVRTTGPTINLNGAWAQNIGESAMFIEFLGDKAGIKLNYGGDFTVYSSKGEVLTETLPSYATTDMFFEEMKDFIRSAQTGEKSRSHIDQVIITTEAMDALYESADKASEIKL
ncbi:Gfo/Idh/MocA family protein [Paenibacillus yanchengensis]|uniref:Gfo/Idh/MocA family protein n=1 Tax=Paenibacillus yanchengensis TaxID=2035833 RepID=A0ABW4YQY0_9BACL